MTKDEVHLLLKSGFKKEYEFDENDRITINNIIVEKYYDDYVVNVFNDDGILRYKTGSLKNIVKYFDFASRSFANSIYNIYDIVKENNFENLITLAEIREASLYLYDINLNRFEYECSIAKINEIKSLKHLIDNNIPIILKIKKIVPNHDITVKCHTVNGIYKIELPVDSINDESLEKLKTYLLLQQL